ncbi:hypothetical protein ABGB16_21810 [Micromonospora sp. B11E3]|uniref:hypothetical protein n=1 Tax=Micromonospora sp. B11E3 TaxID=3153562 RepID=UPI00325D35B5
MRGEACVVVAHPLAQPRGVVQQRVRPVYGGDGRLRVQPGDLVEVALQDRLLDRARVEHVEGEGEQLPVAQPGVGGEHRLGQAAHLPGVGVVLEDLPQHRHEVRLAGAERAVQEHRLRPARRHRVTDARSES